MLFEAGQTKNKRQRSIRKERNQAREPSARLRLVSFVPLLSIFIKENESRLYLFVSKIATSLSGNSSIRVDTIPGNSEKHSIEACKLQSTERVVPKSTSWIMS